MRHVARWTILASCAALIPALAYAQDATIKLPQDITYKAALPGIPQVAVLFGDPTKPGVYVVRVKVPSGLKLMPHWHPDEVRTVVVLSGTFLHGYGERWDEAKLKVHPPGTFLQGSSLRMGERGRGGSSDNCYWTHRHDEH
jgi:hypothetical protein